MGAAESEEVELFGVVKVDAGDERVLFFEVVDIAMVIVEYETVIMPPELVTIKPLVPALRTTPLDKVMAEPPTVTFPIVPTSNMVEPWFTDSMAVMVSELTVRIAPVVAKLDRYRPPSTTDTIAPPVVKT